MSVGEPVTFAVERNNDVGTLRWRHNGGLSMSYLDNMDTYTINSVALQHAGVYECYQNGMRYQGLHAIFQLVVRGEQGTLEII